MNTPPTNAGDPDTPEQAIRNLVSRVKTEFWYKGIWDVRVPDTILLTTRHGYIGVCRDYADLTTGLLRALGFPSRYTDAILTKHRRFWFDEAVGHAWVEAYLGVGGWRQADSTWDTAFDESVYEDKGYRVKEAWADRHPLSSATIRVGQQYQCIPSCYEAPVDCPSCFRDSNGFRFPWPWPNLSCVENVTSRYHQSSLIGLRLAADERLLVRIQAPIFVTRTVPFTLSAGLVNSTTQTLDVLTATLSLYDDISSTLPLYDIAPAYHTTSNLAPGGAVTVTWTVTPLVAGSGLPLRVAAFSGDLFGFDERPLVVNEPGTPPPLTLGGLCGPGTVQPGQPFTLTAYVLDETLRPLTDTLTAITATLYATPTLGYSATAPLALDADDDPGGHTHSRLGERADDANGVGLRAGDVGDRSGSLCRSCHARRGGDCPPGVRRGRLHDDFPSDGSGAELRRSTPWRPMGGAGDSGVLREHGGCLCHHHRQHPADQRDHRWPDYGRRPG